MSSDFANIPTFCVYPWIEMVVQTHGQASYCCVADKGGIIKDNSGKPYIVAKSGFEAAWNSDALREIRRKMLAGERVEGCQRCFKQEELGKESYRQWHNSEWLSTQAPEVQKRVEHSQAHDGLVNGKPLYLDLRLGDLCNLKCRSCNAFNSSQIAAEANILLQNDASFRELFGRHYGVRSSIPKLDPWYDSEDFWNEVEGMLPTLRKIYLTGGEPTLIRGNQRLLRACVEKGVAENISLLFNTNATRLTEDFLEPLDKFRHAQINVSIDAFQEENEYIRYPSRWPLIEKNMRRLLELPSQITIGVTPVVQVYNILTLHRLLEWIEALALEFDRKIQVDFLFAFGPDFLNPEYLPAPVRQEASRRLLEFSASSRLAKADRFLENSLTACLNLLADKPDSPTNDGRLKDFTDYTASLDRQRQQDFAAVFPELSRYLEQPS